MKTITVHASTAYEILIENGLLAQCGEKIRSVSDAKKAVVVTDDIVGPLYAEQTTASLQAAGVETTVFTFPHGEEQKSHATLLSLYSFLCAQNITRKDILVALGGGVVGDLTGFAAATFQRGMAFVQIPTTLLAQIDSSVGGKTGVNIPEGKNLVGAFKQPLLVLCDPAVLDTLPTETFCDGVAEAIKYGAIEDAALFALLDSDKMRSRLDEVIYTCVDIKRRLVEADEFDTGSRMLLNFGHTFGHAIEQHYAYQRYTHGQAVAIGMVKMTRLFEQSGLTLPQTTEQLETALRRYQLPVSDEVDDQALVSACLHDKKSLGGTIHLIGVRKIGESFIHSIPAAGFAKFIEGGR